MCGSDFTVTVAIPAYNESARIATAIRSALAQTEPPTEILVCDDGSTDDTGRIATALGARVLTQQNAGIARARNRIIAEARSSWIAFLDADDVWYERKLEHMRLAHEAAPAIDLLMSDFAFVHEGGRTIAPSAFARTPQYRTLPKRAVSPGAVSIDRHALRDALAVGNFVGVSTLVARRAAFVERECGFTEDLPGTPECLIAEDIEWYLRALRFTDVTVCTAVLGEYRYRPGSASSNYGRVRYGDAKLGERIADDPTRYVEGAAAAFRAERRAHLRHASRIYARNSDFARARAMLCEAQRDRIDPRDAAALFLLDAVATRGGHAVFRAVMRIRDRSRGASALGA